MTRPQPCSQGIGFLGLCSHSSWCISKRSNFTTVVHPKVTLSQVISKRDNKFLSILGTGFSSIGVMGCLSTGQ